MTANGVWRDGLVRRDRWGGGGDRRRPEQTVFRHSMEGEWTGDRWSTPLRYHLALAAVEAEAVTTHLAYLSFDIVVTVSGIYISLSVKIYIMKNAFRVFAEYRSGRWQTERRSTPRCRRVCPEPSSSPFAAGNWTRGRSPFIR